MLILEGTHSAEVKEQALCILANIGDGESAKEYIMANEDVLKKLTDYMVSIVTTNCHMLLTWTQFLPGTASWRVLKLARSWGEWTMDNENLESKIRYMFNASRPYSNRALHYKIMYIWLYCIWNTISTTCCLSFDDLCNSVTTVAEFQYPVSY